jgi:hypothetical protein
VAEGLHHHAHRHVQRHLDLLFIAS